MLPAGPGGGLAGDGVWLGPAFLPLRTALGRDGADAEQLDGDIFVPGASRAVTRVS